VSFAPLRETDPLQTKFHQLVNFERTQTYNSYTSQAIDSSHRGIMFATTADCDERGLRTVEKQTARVFVVLN
jgi:hypothetical protein